MWDIALSAFYDAFLDTVKLLPFLFLGFLMLEFFQHRAGEKSLRRLESAKKAGPAIGALLGIVPQCGFSVMAASFYAGGAVSLGTLLAVLISTSDEAIIVMLTRPEVIPDLLGILAVKIVIAVAIGYVADLIFRRFSRNGRESGLQAEHEAHCHSGCGCSCNSKSELFLNALRHTASTTLFIFLLTFALGLVIGYAGEETLKGVLLTNSRFQPLIAGLVGLIPNCAASVILSELYIEKIISFGALLSGLVTASGIGLVALFRATKDVKRSMLVLLILYVVGIMSGFAADLIR